MKMTTDVTSPVACSPVDIKNCDILAREGFAYCYSTNAGGEADAIYIFGGLVKEGKSGDDDYRETNELIMYKPSSGEASVLWKQPADAKEEDNSNDYPSARSGASVALAGDRLFMFGGFNHHEAWLNDLWIYQLPNGPWRKADLVAGRPSLGATPVGSDGKPVAAAAPSVGTPLPTPRDKATLTAVTTASSTHLWLFGGFGPVPAGGIIDEDSEDVEDDVEDGDSNGKNVEDGGPDPAGKPEKAGSDDKQDEKQDPLRLTWFDDMYCINATPNPDGLFDVKKPMQMNLDSPTPRAAHGATVFTAKNGNDNVVIFGGRDTDGRTNDLSIFDTKTRKWTAYDIDNPEEGDDVDEEEEEGELEGEGDIEEEDIEQDSEEGNGEKDGAKKSDADSGEGGNKEEKEESNGASKTVLSVEEQVKKNLEAIRKKTTLAEMNTEKQGTVLPPWPESRSYMSVCVSQNRWLFIFGGRNENDGQLNDLWMFDLENPSNGWYNLENASKSDVSWPRARSGAILVPMSPSIASGEQCKLLLVAGCADLHAESMHCSTLFTNGYEIVVNMTAALAMERKPVEVPAVSSSETTAAALKAAKKCVMAALKGEDIEQGDGARPRKRSASPSSLGALDEDHKNGNESKRVRCATADS